jgi:hypothetical protein
MTEKRPRVDLAAVRAEEERRAEGFRMIDAFVDQSDLALI